MVMEKTTDAVAACYNLVRFFARESCGKCTPCREGTAWMGQILTRIFHRQASPEDLDLLLDICDNISPARVSSPEDVVARRGIPQEFRDWDTVNCGRLSVLFAFSLAPLALRRLGFFWFFGHGMPPHE